MRTPSLPLRALALTVAALLAATWTVVAPVGPAGAHAVLVSTSPEAGALLDAAPAEVSVTFDEPVEWDATAIVVIDESGEPVGGEPTSSGATVRAPVPSEGQGWFAVSWHVVSADGHPLSGAWTYRVGEGSDVAPEGLVEQAAAGTTASTSARWTWTVAQWGSALASVVLLGTAFVAAISLYLGSQRRLAIAAGVAAVATSVLAAGANGPHVGPRVDWFDGPASDELLVRAVLAALATALLAWRRPRAASTRLLPRVGPVILAGAALAVSVRSGHAGAEGGAAVAAIGAHLVVGGCWLGAAPAVLLGVRDGGETARLVLARFSRAAAWLLVAVLVLGVTGALLLSGGPSEVTDDWGALLVAKVAFVVMAALAGGWTRFNVLPHLERLRPIEVRAPLWFDVAVLAAVVTTSIALTHNGPPRLDPLPEPLSFVAEDDEVTVQVLLDPARVGPNDIHVFVLDRVGMPTEVEEVTLTLSSAELGIGEIPVAMSDLGAGHLSTRVDDIGLAGTWELHVVVRPTPFTQLEIDESFDVPD